MRAVVSLLVLALVLSTACSESRRGRTGTDSGPTRLDAGPTGVDGSIADHCANGRRDGDEPHVDCGGSCPQCADGAHCYMPADCVNGVCLMGFCLMPSCADGVQNGPEVDVDCGGGSCPGCPGGTTCTAGTDCLSGVCESGTCSDSSCFDGLLNADETDVDCGGSCDGCTGGAACVVDEDCASLICDAGTCTTADCRDSVRNQDESDVDCGGTLCSPCVDGRGCGMGDDCMSRVCTSGSCVAPSCTDATQNQDESDVDCGGTICPGCADGSTCAAASDCASGVCTGGACQAPTCTDGVQNGMETDVDCGGTTTCPRCPDFRECTVAADCASAACTMGRCGTTGCIPFPGTSTDTFGYFGCSLPLTPATLPCPDISATGTNASLFDDSHAYVPIGFSFDFYGTPHTQVAIQSNGTLVFANVYQSYGNVCLPTTSNNFLAVMWDDLNPGTGGGSVKYQTLGTAPSRTFVVQWDTQRYPSTPMRADMRVVLYEGSNDIHVCYNHTNFGSASYDNGANATAGLNGPSSSLQFSCNAASLTTGLFLQYLHP